MIAEAGAAISSIKVAMDMAKAISALKSETEINQAIIDIQRTLLEAQSGAIEDKLRIAELTEQNSLLSKQAQIVSRWENEKQRYRLTKSSKGAFTYNLKSEFANDEIDHRLCATCFEAGKKALLHTIAKGSGGEVVKCQTCQSELTLSDFQHEYVSIGRRATEWDEYEG